MKRFYFDHAATTPVAPEVVKVLIESLSNDFGNVSSVNYFGQKEKLNLRRARQTAADYLNAGLNEIYFTSGATESNNTVIRQTANARKNEGRHLITSAVEHPSVLRVMEDLANNGFEVTFLPVNESGTIELEDLQKAIRPDTTLVSIMYANHETGALMPIKEIGQLLEKSDIWFHVDATQAFGVENIDVKALNIDFLSASAHKIYGPKGIGLLYKKGSRIIKPLLLGGNQENKMRAGTTNIPSVMAYEEAIKLCSAEDWSIKYEQDKRILVDRLKKLGVDFSVNGDFNNALPQILNLWLKGVPSDVILPLLDLDGFAVSAGSACTAGSAEDSHVLLSMYPNDIERVRESIRISFGRDNKEEDVLNLADAIAKHINRRLELKERAVN